MTGPAPLTAAGASSLVNQLETALLAIGYDGAQVPAELAEFARAARVHVTRQPWCTPEHLTGLDHLDAYVRWEFEARRQDPDDPRHRSRALFHRQERERALLQARQANEREALESSLRDEQETTP